MSNLLTKVLALMVPIFLCWGSKAQAEELPTSETPASSVWSYMTPSSFHSTVASAIEQCERTARTDLSGRLELSQCESLKQLLEGNQCEVKMVKDGIVFDRMNGRINNNSMVTSNIVKRLGREDRALLCNLGNQVYAYWFIGEKKKSCNNVGFVYAAKPLKPVDGACGSNAKVYQATDTMWPTDGTFCKVGTPSQSNIMFPDAGSSTLWTCQGSDGGKPDVCPASRGILPLPPPKVVMKEKVKVCRWIEGPVYEQFVPGVTTSLSGVVVPVCSCCGPGFVSSGGVFSSTPGQTMRSSSMEWVCE